MKTWAALVFILAAAAGALLFVRSGDSVNAGLAIAPGRAVRYEIMPGESKFMVEAGRAGLLWFKGHDHHLAVRDFRGSAELTPTSLDPASLELTVNAASLEETSDVFTQQQKGIIKKELDEIVLETAKYPEIRFRSTNVKGALRNGRFEVKIAGDLTLHGVTRRIEIPATVSLDGDRMRATGEFSLDRKDFDVKATSAFHGLVRVSKKLKFTFDIVGRRV